MIEIDDTDINIGNNIGKKLHLRDAELTFFIPVESEARKGP